MLGRRDASSSFCCLIWRALKCEWLWRTRQFQRSLCLPISVDYLLVQASHTLLSSFKVSQLDSLLSTCYSLLESIIAFMTLGSSLSLEDRQITQLHAAMVGAFNAVVLFLGKVQNEPRSVVSACSSSVSSMSVDSEIVLMDISFSIVARTSCHCHSPSVGVMDCWGDFSSECWSQTAFAFPLTNQVRLLSINLLHCNSL